MSLMNLKICKIYKNVSPGESYTAVTNKEEFLIKKEHDLFCPSCSKKFINTVSRLKAMFQRSAVTYWCMKSLDRLSVGPIPWRSVICVGEESQPLDLCLTGLLGYLFTGSSSFQALCFRPPVKHMKSLEQACPCCGCPGVRQAYPLPHPKLLLDASRPVEPNVSPANSWIQVPHVSLWFFYNELLSSRDQYS